MLISGHKICSEYQGPVLATYATKEYLRRHPQAAALIDPKTLTLLFEEDIGRICGEGQSKGVLKCIPLPRLAPLSDSVHKGDTNLAFLHGLADPRNVGSIIRTAACLGWRVAPPRMPQCAPVGQEVIRSAKGAHIADGAC